MSSRSSPDPPDPALAGSLLGLALGDALGFAVEALDPPEAARYAAGLTAGPLDSSAIRARHPYRAGQYSDDTQQARELLRSIADCGQWQAAAFAARLAALFAAGHDVGAGPGTRGAALRLHAGVSLADAAAPADYAGNGAAMRAAPLGLLFGGERLLAVASEQARITHRHPACAAGAAAIALAARLLASADADPAAIPARVAAYVRPLDRDTASALLEVTALLPLEPGKASARLVRLGLDPLAPREYSGITAHVLPSVCWALYAALRHADAWPRAVATAIAAGGDTDTTGAMAGAMVGARIGAAALPPAARAVHDRGSWGHDALLQLAAMLRPA